MGTSKASGKKIVGRAFRGEELKDSYELTGKALFRISTATGHYDTPVNLKILAEEIPF